MFMDAYVCQQCGNIDHDPAQYKPCQECGGPSGYDNWLQATFELRPHPDAPPWWKFWSNKPRKELIFLGYDPSDPYISGLPRMPRWCIPGPNLGLGVFRLPIYNTARSLEKLERLRGKRRK